MPYTETDVRDWVGPDTYRRAVPLVAVLEDVSWGEAAREGDLVASATVPGKREHLTSVYRMRGTFSSRCTCPERNCMHAAALALRVREQAAPAPEPVAGPGWEERLAAWTAPAPPAPAVRALFVYRLRWPLGPDGEPEVQVQVSHASSPTFQALPWHLYRVGQADDEADRLVEAAIRRIRGRRAEYRDGETRTAASWLVVPVDALEDLLPKLGLHPRVEDERRRPLAIHPTITVKASLAVREVAGQTTLVPGVVGPRGFVERGEVAAFGPPGGRWAACGGEIFRLAAGAEAAWSDLGAITVPEAQREAFEARWRPALAQAGVLFEAEDKPWAEGEPVPQLVLEEEREALWVRAGFRYGEARVEAGAEGEWVETAAGPRLKRDAEAEGRHLAAVRGALPAGALRGEAAIAFLEDTCPGLIEAGWELVGRDRLREHRLATATPGGRLSVKTGTDWFDIHSEVILGAEVVAWPTLQRALESGARYVRLGSGEWARLPVAWLEAQRRLRSRLEGQVQEDGALRVSAHQAPVLAEAIDAHGDAVVDEAWRAFRARLEGAREVAVAPGFTGTLRPYQREGLAFLTFLRDAGLHGILADDMGLGKTVQTAALLAANHPSDEGPSLIVAPTSLLENWQAELARFAPGLRVRVLHGKGRDWEAVSGCDVVITSYATARLDVERHRRLRYHTLILDEAQAIKNWRSQTARAMRRLEAKHRLCLTGTPLENDTRDIFSLFAFLVPGMLGDEESFRSRYATPIAIGDPAAREDLRRRIGPFILRRLKSQVATDLPPRTDIVVRCELAPAQRKAYDALLASTRDRIQRKVASEGLERSRLSILDALLRLRQLCCHPALVGTPETMALESGKLESAMALVEELIAGGHRALVFSQFTNMLAILRQRLDAAGIAYEYLDGGTGDRQARVDRFNAGSAPLFLISLKAGGTGLNLTGADYVIHYDPWWNPASEDQATDRAHRIGQTRPVFNYKLVASGTIEEKLIRLQQEKRGLVRDLLATDASGAMWTEAEVAALFE